MEEIKRISEWKPRLQPVLASKKSEFRLMGYKRASEKEIWDCLVHKVWKGDPQKRLYEAVGDIFHLSTNIYLSYITVQAYQNDDLRASVEALFQPQPE